MKKMFPLALLALLALPVVAQEATAEEETTPAQKVERTECNTWPAFFAVCQWPRATDVIGLRLTVPFSTSQEGITGIDVGFWGKSLYFEGLQLNLLRNDVKDTCAGLQAGIYNSVAIGDLTGVQLGLWNEAIAFRGLQAGIINVVGDGEGFQVGIINRAETLQGYQIGLINVIRDAEVKFLPILNIGF